MESLRHDVGDSEQARSGAAERPSAGGQAPGSVGELTARELDLQHRLVLESLLIRPV